MKLKFSLPKLKKKENAQEKENVIVNNAEGNQEKNQENNGEEYIEVSLSYSSDISKMKDIEKQIKNNKQAKKFMNTIKNIYRYYIEEITEKSVALVTQDNKYKYIAFTIPRENIFKVIIHDINIENQKIKDEISKKVRAYVSSQVSVEFEDIKNKYKPKFKIDYLIYGTTAVVMVGGAWWYKEKSAPKPTLQPHMPHVNSHISSTQSVPKPQVLSPEEQHYASIIAQYQCYIDLDKKLKQLEQSNIKVSKVTVNLGATPASATCSYNITEVYDYPAVGTRLAGNHYEKQENKNIVVDENKYQQEKGIVGGILHYANFVNCLNLLKEMNAKVLSRSGVLQATFEVQDKIPEANLYKLGSLLYTLQSLCGYSLSFQTFTADKSGLNANLMFNWTNMPQTNSIEQASNLPPPVNKQVQASPPQIPYHTNINIKVSANGH